MKSILQILAVSLVVLFSTSCDALTEERDKEWKELLNKGMNAIRAQKWTEAEETLDKSLIEAEKFGKEDKRVAASLVNLACCYAKKGDYEKAIKVSRKALNIDEKEIGDSHAVAYDLNQLGFYLDCAGKNKEATTLFLRSKAISTKLLQNASGKSKRVHQTDLGTTFGHLAENMILLKKYDEAEKYANEMLKVFRELENPKLYFSELDRVVVMFDKIKDKNDIESLFRREYAALEKKHSEKSQWVRVLNSRHGKYYMDKKDYVKGEEFYRKILAFRKENKKKNILIAEAANALAVCLSRQHKYKEAFALYRRSPDSYGWCF